MSGTDDGRLRHPIFLGIRIDKDPRNVTSEPTRSARATSTCNT